MSLHYPEWIARLPMTKAAVRAMDSVIAFTEKTRQTHITQYIVGGASKRGWTSWTTAAVDKRVVGTVCVEHCRSAIRRCSSHLSVCLSSLMQIDSHGDG